MPPHAVGGERPRAPRDLGWADPGAQARAQGYNAGSERAEPREGSGTERGEARGTHLGAQVSPGWEAASRLIALCLARASRPASRAWGVCLENGG